MSSEKIKLIDNIINKSFFSLIEDEVLLNELIQSAKLELVSKGEYISRALKPGQMFIVAQGEVGLYENKIKKGIVTEGRSLELASLVNDEPTWRYNWQAEQESRVIVLEEEDVNNFFSKKPNLKIYLQRMTSNTCFQKFKHDLHILGYTERECVATIGSMDLFSEEYCEIEEQIFFIVESGSLVLQTNKSDHIFCHGEYIFANTDLEKIKTLVTLKDKVWYIPVSNWKKQVAPNKVDNVVHLLGVSINENLNVENEYQAKELEEDFDHSSDLEVLKGVGSKYKKRLPLVWQQDETDCGAACLSMICAYYGKRISVSRIRDLIHVTKEGTSLADMEYGALKLGFHVAAVEADVEEIANYSMPAIILSDYHYSCLMRSESKHYIISDPATGIQKVSKSEIAEHHSGFSLLLKPKEEFYFLQEDVRPLRKMLSILDGFKISILTLCGLTICYFLFSLFYPFAFSFFVDNLNNTSDKFKIYFSLVLMGSLFLKNITDYIRREYFFKIFSQLDYKISTAYVNKILMLPYKYFLVRRTGDFLAKFFELQKIQNFLTGNPLVVMFNMFSVIIFSSILYLYHYYFLFLFSFAVIIYVPILFSFSNFIEKLYHQKFSIYVKQHNKLIEGFENLLTTQRLQAQIPNLNRWSEHMVKEEQMNQKIDIAKANFHFIASVFEYIAACFFLILATHLYKINYLTLGEVIAVSTISLQLLSPVVEILSEWQSFKEVNVSFDKVDSLMTSANEKRKDFTYAHKIKGDIKLENISFRHGGDNTPYIIKDLNLNIKAGEKIAILGHSGSGKSTTGLLINSLLKPSTGQVLLDDRHCEQYDLEELRNQVVYLGQDVSTINASILENIALGEESPIIEKVIEAAKLAEIHETISRKKFGYNTQLTQIPNLSGGERQRIALARVFYKDPSVLIMDECTSALDGFTSEKIMNNIEKYLSNKTIIFITHRLEMVKYVDRIFVFESGSLKEEGTHDSLMASHGAYYNLTKNYATA